VIAAAALGSALGVLERAHSSSPTTLPARVSTIAFEDNANTLRSLRRDSLIEQARAVYRSPSFDAADAAGRLLSEAFMYRHHPQAAKLVELVRAGAIGELRVVRSAFSYSLYDADNIRLRTDVEGGALMDVGCYCVSGSRLLAGEPEWVMGSASIGSSGTDWVFAGMMRFPGAVTALFDCGTSLPNRDELEAIGTEGSLFLDDPWHCNEPVLELRKNGEVERIEAERGNPYRLELEGMNAAIRGERPLLLGRDDALGQARAIRALFESASTGRRVEV
jgi:predicted dehydrogenase